MASARSRANQKGKSVKGEGDEPESQELGPFANLPSTIITTHIMVRLPIKSLAICRLVCRTWNELISDPHFAKLRLQHAPPIVMIRTNDYDQVSRTLHLLEFEMFESILNNRVKLEPSFKLPLHDTTLPSASKNRRHWRDYKKKDGKFGVVTSCNGFLCLQSTSKRDLVVCNPVTGEFIPLPKAIEVDETSRRIYTGFGFHPKTNEYKVVRIWATYDKCERSVVVHICTLGKQTWRNVDVDNEFLTKIRFLTFPTCVNGSIHWLNFDERQMSILCFDFEGERFQSFPSPPLVLKDGEIIDTSRISMAELGGFLYVCDASSYNSCMMCVMKEYGVGGSWTKIFSIDNLPNPRGRYGLCWPVKRVEKGAAILIQHSSNCFFYYEPEKNGYKLLWVIGTQTKSFELIPHIPSLVSLKDIVNGDNVEVLNVHSRCGKFKLEEEDEVLFLTGES